MTHPVSLARDSPIDREPVRSVEVRERDPAICGAVGEVERGQVGSCRRR